MSSPQVADRYDVVVLGGGISGLAIARKVARNNYATLLLEKDRIGAATSANSLRIIHGGFRYLQSFDISRVIRSLKDQSRVEREFPELVRVLPCYLPLNRSGLKSRWPLQGAALLYALLALASQAKVRMPRILSESAARAQLPFLMAHVPSGAFLWHDLQLINPEALHASLAEQLGEAGGVVQENSRVVDVRREDRNFCIDVERKGVISTISARIVVNALGPWVDSLIVDRNIEMFPPHLGWCRAFNLVYRGNKFGTFGAGIPSADGRLLFAVGRDHELAVGTEYLPLSGEKDYPEVTQHEVSQFHQKIAATVPGLSLNANMIERVEVGVLPIDRRVANPADGLLGSAQILDCERYITVLSTKYTTFLSQADEVLAIIKNHPFLRESKAALAPEVSK